jgi:hypothetical protein
MVLSVKLAFLKLYSEKSFINSYHEFILNFIVKGGYLIEEKSKKDEIISYILSDKGKIQIPNKPTFSHNKDLRLNILALQYFIN